MKFLISILAAVSLIAMGVSVIEVNAQPNISNSPGDHDFGTLDAGSTAETGLDWFTVTNDSATNVTITIIGTDMTGGVTWELSDTATPDENKYGLMAGLESGSYDIIVKKADPFFLVEGLATGTQRWGLQLLAPTSFTDEVAKEGTVTLTATQAP